MTSSPGPMPIDFRLPSAPNSSASSSSARRLLYVGGFDFPTTQARGIQTLHTAHALARAGWGVRLLAQRPMVPRWRFGGRAKALQVDTLAGDRNLVAGDPETLRR